MIVVSDTSPIHYLILIREIDVLPALYPTILIPPMVREELSRPRTPQAVRSWMANSPAWLETRAPRSIADGRLERLDPGEREAILLSCELSADQLIIDETRGRLEARSRQIPYTGLLGILRVGGKLNLLHLPSAIARLRETNFHAAPEILAQILKPF